MALDIVLDQFEGAHGGSMGGGSITTKEGLEYQPGKTAGLTTKTV